MKEKLTGLAALCLLCAPPLFAAETEAVNEAVACDAKTAQVEACAGDNADTTEGAVADPTAALSADAEWAPLWHCTAYPNGHGHSHGHEAFGRNYYNTYYRALRSCQRYHGPCHVHCHRDH